MKTVVNKSFTLIEFLAEQYPGYPIVGDRKYGASDDFIRRIRLHAYSLSFPHPVSGGMITVLSPMPAGFLSLKAKDEHYK